MERYGTAIEGGTVYLESAGDRVEVGTMADIHDVVGGEEYAIEYDDTEVAYFDWLDTDDEGMLRFDVRETVADMTYPADFVDTLRQRPLDGADGDLPERTAYFAELLVDIWDSRGDLDGRDENPFA
jgi:hypothetical protein